MVICNNPNCFGKVTIACNDHGCIEGTKLSHAHQVQNHQRVHTPFAHSVPRRKHHLNGSDRVLGTYTW